MSRLTVAWLLAGTTLSVVAVHGPATNFDEAVVKPPAECDEARALKVLFVGNSFTYLHNMPRMVQEIAERLPGPCITTTMVAIGGATLEDHWRSDSVATRIRRGRWTHVVLQDHSTFGEVWWLEGTPRVGTSGAGLAEFGRRFVHLARQGGATPVLLAHWASATAPARDQQSLDFLFDSVAYETGSLVAPVGLAIKAMQVDLSAVSPYHSDEHHLSPAGAYMEALVIYTTLTGIHPRGAPRRIVGPEVSFAQGGIADAVVTLVELSESEARTIQHLVSQSYDRAAKVKGRVVAPPPLSAGFPTLPQSSGRITVRELRGAWRGKSRIMPIPADDSMTIEFIVGESSQPAGSDTLHLRNSIQHLAGPLTVTAEGTRAVVRATVLPMQGPSRGRRLPFDVEIELVPEGRDLRGLVRIFQRTPGSSSHFTALATVRLRRTGD